MNDFKDNFSIFIALSVLTISVHAQDEFDSNFFQGSNISIDRFKNSGAVQPGNYNLSINVNGKYVGKTDVRISEEINGLEEKSIACSSQDLILLLGLRNINEINQDNENEILIEENEISEINDINKSKNKCIDLTSEIPYINYSIDLSELSLNVTIPQMYLNTRAQGATDPKFWEDGINAGFANYNLNYNENKNSNGDKNRNLFSMFNFGINFGLWQFRNNSNYNYQNNQGGKWNTINSYIKRPISSLNSNLVIGEFNTGGQYFDSISFTGAQLSSDERMLPNSLQGFAPVVRGIAQSNSVVEVRQQGILLYKTTVSQGPFIIDDLYPTGYGGELEVTVTGADGQVQMYQVPYSSVSQLLRPGLSRYSVTVGELRNSFLDSSPKFLQGWYARGLSNALTGYAGAQLSENYQSAVAGVALNTIIGAVSVDLTNSIADLDNGKGKKKGWSAKISHSKLIQATDTYLALSAYRFSSEDYFNFTDASSLRESQSYLFPNRKERFEVSINQPLAKNGNLYLSGSKINYWGGRSTETYLQGGYNFNFKGVNIGLNVSRVEREENENENVYSLMVNIPLQNKARNFSNLNTSYTHSKDRSQIIAGMTGTFNDGSLTYGISDSYTEHQGNTISGNVTKSFSQGQASLLASKSKDYSQYAMGLSGSIVAHSKGITLGQYSTDSLILVEAKNAKGAQLEGASNVYIDRFGYGIIPYLNPYRVNEVVINPQKLPDNTELKVHSKQVVPYSGAIIKLKFDTVTGHKAFIYSEEVNGEHLPVGAMVLNEQQDEVGIVGQAGIIYVTGLQDSGVLKAKWSEKEQDSCLLRYDFTTESQYEKNNGIYSLPLICEK